MQDLSREIVRSDKFYEVPLEIFVRIPDNYCHLKNGIVQIIDVSSLIDQGKK